LEGDCAVQMYTGERGEETQGEGLIGGHMGQREPEIDFGQFGFSIFGRFGHLFCWVDYP
jgi:hypothetical protein